MELNKTSKNILILFLILLFATSCGQEEIISKNGLKPNVIAVVNGEKLKIDSFKKILSKSLI